MLTQQAEQHVETWRLYVQWLVLNLAGWLTGLWLLFNIGWSVGWSLSQRPSLNLSDVVAYTLGFAVGSVIGGALIGVVQAAVLHERGISYRAWIAATVGGLVTGFVITIPIVSPLESPNNIVALVLIALISGLPVAVSQWLVLRSRLPRASWWVPAATLGFALCFLAIFLLGGEGQEELALGAGVLANALVTGLAVVAMFRP